jgi:Carboxypeptidase regulatory-like domain
MTWGNGAVVRLLGLSLAILVFGLSGWAAVGGSISGTVKDPSDAVIPGAMLTVTNTALGTQFKTTTDAMGYYSFPSLPVGRYDMTVDAGGFKTYKQVGLVIDTDSALQIDPKLAISEQSESTTVTAEEQQFQPVRVETVATHLGEVVSDTKMTALPLNGRSYTDLLPIQPGVVPGTSLKGSSVIMAGVTGAIDPSGELNPGNMSIGGQRETANGFMVDGVDVQEHMNGGTSIIPNLDSISEFRVLTNNFDPQYGNYNGGMINVVTKSGSDRFHGDAFEFLRNTSLDAKNYFAPERAAFRQNQFGGTLGGPIKKQSIFFFGDYQGTRTTQGVDSGLITVPSDAERSGNFSDIASSLTGIVNGNNWANVLSQRLGYSVSAGEPYYMSGCVNSAQCVFPNAVIPQKAWSNVAQNLLQYIPAPNSGADQFSTAAFPNTVSDNKAAGRIDANSRFGLLSAYYFFDGYTRDDPYPTQQGGASVPGFDAQTIGRAQLISLSDIKVFGNTVNEFHFGVTRNANDVGRPHGGLGVSVASQGFVTGPGTPGIVVQAPQFEGIENLVFNNFVMGVTITGVQQNNTTAYWSDDLSKVIGSHTVHIGGQFHYDQVNMHPNATFNGTFTISGTETGSDIADFLLGIPSNYIQSAGQGFYLRNRYLGIYGQDSWRVKSNLTLNYGVRWDVIMPWHEKYNQLQTVVPGQQSQVYPGAPLGFVFPTDTGIPSTLSPTRYNNVAPRIGVAYAPGFEKGLLKAIFGERDKSSIRASYGVFYTAFQGLSAGIMYAVPPYGYNYLSPAPPLFDQPFITAADGTNNGQRFPLASFPTNVSVQNPDRSINWSNFIPISADPFFATDNRPSYSENYMLSLQRQLPRSLVLTLSYVGNQAHHLLVVQQANPGNPALCLSVSKPSQVAPGSPTCGPFAENGVFTTNTGQVINSTRGPLGPNYGTMTAQRTIGNSNYNALEANLRFVARSMDFLIGYTYSKSIDQSSNIGEQVNPFNPSLTRAISSFDLRHNFVASYRYDLPFASLLSRHNRLTDGWSLSGTVRFTTGFPVSLYNNTDTSLLGTFGNGVNNDLLDTPNVAAGPLNIQTDPRKGQPEFNAALFSLPALGQLGTAPRRFFYGPGINNVDMTIAKTIALTEGKSLEMRLEGFNVFNHPQFFGPTAVEGNITSPNFGQVINAASPRLMQLAAKFSF